MGLSRKLILSPLNQSSLHQNTIKTKETDFQMYYEGGVDLTFRVRVGL